MATFKNLFSLLDHLDIKYGAILHSKTIFKTKLLCNSERQIKACDQTQYAVIKKSAIRILLTDNSYTGITILSVNSWTPANRKNYLSSSKNFLMFPVVPSPEYTTLVSSNLFSITLGRNSTMLLWTKEKMHF